MSIYEKAEKAVANGYHYYVDFRSRELKIGNKYIIKGDEIFSDDDFFPEEISQKPFVEHLRVLYHDYKHSLPTKNDCRRHKFKALRRDKLPQEDSENPNNRKVCEVKLLMWVLLSFISGKLTWSKECFGNEFNEEWYAWQDKYDEALVIRRTWFF